MPVPGLRLRKTSPADVPAMIELATANPSAAQWSQGQYERLFAMAENAEVSANQEHRFPEHFVLAAEHGAGGRAPRLIAFLVAHRVGQEWQLQNITVSKTFQRKRIGTLLLSEFIAHARRERASEIFLEVRESNHSARALYQNAAFKEVGLRKNYYSNPIENAVLYRFSL